MELKFNDFNFFHFREEQNKKRDTRTEIKYKKVASFVPLVFFFWDDLKFYLN